MRTGGSSAAIRKAPDDPSTADSGKLVVVRDNPGHAGAVATGTGGADETRRDLDRDPPLTPVAEPAVGPAALLVALAVALALALAGIAILLLRN
jgi:hypothetical protein